MKLDTMLNKTMININKMDCNANFIALFSVNYRPEQVVPI